MSCNLLYNKSFSNISLIFTSLSTDEMEMDTTCLGDYLKDMQRLKIFVGRNDQSFSFLEPEGLTPIASSLEANARFF